MTLGDALDGRAAVITGAGSGIGRALALAFAGRGMHIVASDIEADEAEATAEAARALGVQALAVETDVTSREQVTALADASYEAFGSVGLLCNNAGVPGRGGIIAATAGDWDWVLEVNLNGVVNGLLAFLPRLLGQSEPAHIVNTSSMAGLLPYATAGLYNTSKFGAFGLSEALRLELAPHGIGVTTLCPGSVDTRFSEGGRLRPERHGGPIPASERPAGMRPMTAAEVAPLVVTAVRENRPYVFPSPGTRARLEQRFAEILEHVDR